MEMVYEDSVLRVLQNMFSAYYLIIYIILIYIE